MPTCEIQIPRPTVPDANEGFQMVLALLGDAELTPVSEIACRFQHMVNLQLNIVQ